MNQRTRVLTGLTAGVLAVSAMAFGFSKWSSEINLNGAVSANGKWDVAVTAASAQVSGTGAQMGAVQGEATYNVVTYPVYVHYNSGYYHYYVGDDEAAVVSMSRSEFTSKYQEASNPKFPVKYIGVARFNSGAKSGDYTFALNVNENGAAINAGEQNRSSIKAVDNGEHDGQQIGTAIAWCFKGQPSNTPENDKIQLTWADAKNYFAEHETSDAVETVDATCDVTVYPITVTTSNGYYAFQVDDQNPETVAMTKAQLDAYDQQYTLNQIYDPASKEYRRFASGYQFTDNTWKSSLTAKICFNEGFAASDFATNNGMSNSKVADDNDLNAYVGKQVGSMVLYCVGGSSTTVSENPNLKAPDWKQASTKLAENPTVTRNLTAVFTEDTVTYAPVEFTLPEAWANYTVTITNNGTVNANLADCKVVTSLDDGSDFADAFEVSVPEFGADEVLAPGESCTFNVVVKALNDADGNMAASTGSFTIGLNYVQDEVEAAPEVSHSHS